LNFKLKFLRRKPFPFQYHFESFFAVLFVS
jgi:hypothetical protein